MKTIQFEHTPRSCACPKCSRVGFRHSKKNRAFFDYNPVLGIFKMEGALGNYYCIKCRKHFLFPLPNCQTSHRYSDAIQKMVLEKRKTMTFTDIQKELHEIGIDIPITTMNTWALKAPKKRGPKPKKKKVSKKKTTKKTC